MQGKNNNNNIMNRGEIFADLKVNNLSPTWLAKQTVYSVDTVYKVLSGDRISEKFMKAARNAIELHRLQHAS